MEQKPVRDTPCPHCNGVLYSITPTELHLEYWTPVTGSPPIQRDDQGRFVICPHCAQRASLDHMPWIVGGEFRVADVQPEPDSDPS